MPEIRLIRHRTEKRQREILRPVDGRTGRKADLENFDPSGYPGCGGRKLHMETVSGTDEAEGIPVEAEPEVHCIKSTGDGTVYPSAEPWEALLGREHPAVDLTAKEHDTCWERRNFQNPEKEVKGDTGPVLFLSVSDGCSKAEAPKDLPGASGRHPETGCQDRANGIPPEASDHHP